LADFLSFFQTKASLCPFFAYFSYILSRSGRIWLQSLKKVLIRVTKYFKKFRQYKKTQNFMLIFKKLKKLQKSPIFPFLLMIKKIWITIFC
jgi:hypothetical protein